MKISQTFRTKILALAISGILAGSAPLCLIAAPQNGQIRGGQGSITNPDANTTQIQQNSHNLVLDWSSFNVSAQEQVNFLQPSSSASALNNIHDQNPSQILGAINANGRVFLSNPNGLIFGPNSTVNVNSLIASGFEIESDAFMSGEYKLNALQKAGSVINYGLINAATGGNVALLGGHVANHGKIIANYGRVALASGSQMVLDFDGDGLMSFQVNEQLLTNSENFENAVHNTGSINADAGQIVLEGQAAADVFTNVVNNEGLLQATSMVNEGGVIRLQSSGRTLQSGTLDVTNSNGQGGEVQILGNQVGLIGTASVDASGSSGGGVVLIGGDFQGSNPSIQNASQTHIGNEASIHADAIDIGDGGRVIVWADQSTQYYGSISARGGNLTGDGGFAEISGKTGLVKRGSVDLGADAGQVGTLLLDPDSIEIIGGTNDGSDSGNTSNSQIRHDQTSADPDGINGNGVILFADTPANFEIYESELEGENNNIILQATDKIFVSGTFGSGDVLIRNDRNLTLQTSNAASADGINLTAVSVIFKTQGTGTISIQTGTDTNTTGSAPVIVGGLQSAGGSIDINSIGSVTAGSILSNNGAVTLNGPTMSLGAINTGNGLLKIINSDAANQSGIFSGSGGLTKEGIGTLTLSQINDYTGTTTISEGTLTLNASGTIATSSGVANASSFTIQGDKIIDSMTGNGTTALGANTLTIGDATGTSSIYGGVISGVNGNLTKDGAGTLTLTGANDYTGTTTISAGILAVDGTTAKAGTGGPIAVGANTLNINNGATLDNAITITTGTIGNTAGTGTLATGGVTLNGAANLSSTGNGLIISAVITETAPTDSVTKVGAGTVTLSGANDYTGGTTISAGTLAVDGATAKVGTGGTIAVGTSSLNINNGATLANAVTITTGTIGNTAGIGTLATGGVTLNGDANLNSTGTGLIIDAAISGANGITTTAGTGTVTLGGGNAYTGTTTIDASSLLTLSATGTIDTSAGVANAGSFTIQGDKTIDSMTGNGTTALGANTLTIGDITGTSSIYGGIASGTGGITTAGTGTLTLGGVNDYTGATTISAGGGLTLNATGTIATSSGVANAGNFTIQGDKTIDSMTGSGTTSLGANTLTIGDATNTSSIYGGVISGANGSLTKDGAGTLTLTGVNDYTGTTTISAGILAVDGATAKAGTGGPIAVGANTLNINNGATLDNAVTITTGTIGNTAGTGTLATGGVTLTGDANLNSTGTGLIINAAISGANGITTTAGTGTVTLGGGNAYTGTTTIDASSLLTLSTTGSIATSSGVANAGNFTIQGDKTIDSMTGNGTTALGANTLTIGDATGTSSIYGGVISGTNGNLTKDGAGTLTLSGANDYTGTTTISAGILAVDGATAKAGNGGTIAVGPGTLNINNGATLDNAVTITTGTIGNTAGIGTLAIGGVTLNGAANLSSTGNGLNISTVISETAPTDSVTKVGAGTVTLSGTNDYTGSTTISAGTLVVDGPTANAGNGGTLSVGANTLNINNGATLANAVTITTGTIGNTDGTGTLASAGGVTLNGDANLNSTGTGLIIDAAISGANGITTTAGTGTVTLGGGNAYTGTTSIDASSLLTLSATGTIDTSAGVANAGSFTIQGDKTIDSMTGNGTTALGVNTLTIGDISGTSSTYDGVISGAGGLIKAGAGTLTLGGDNTYDGLTGINGGTIRVTSNNALGTITAGTSIATNATLDFDNINYSTLEAISLNGGRIITDNGVSTFAGPVTLGAISSMGGNGSLTVTGIIDTVTFDLDITAGPASSINLNNSGNDFNTVIITSANNVTLNDIDDIDMGTSNLSGNLDVSATGITQTGAIIHSAVGTTSFNGGAGSIILNNSANDFTGTVSLSNTGPDNVSITDTNAIELGLSDLGSGTLTVNAVGIAQSAGGIIIQQTSAGDATFNAGNGVITLNEANDFTGTVLLNNTGANAVSVTDANDIQLGATTLSDDLNVTATSGQITASGLLTAASIDLTAANGIGSSTTAIQTATPLINFLNTTSGGSFIRNFSAGGVTISNDAANFGDVDFTETLGEVILGGAFTGDTVSITSSTAAINYDPVATPIPPTLTANSLNLSAVSGIGNSNPLSPALTTSTSTLSFTNSTNDVRISNLSGWTVSGNAGSGNINLDNTAGNLSLNSLVTNADLILTASSGAIIDANDNINPGTVNLSGNNVTLTASAGIGSADAIETSINSLTFNNNSATDIQIVNSSTPSLVLQPSSNLGAPVSVTQSTPGGSLIFNGDLVSGDAAISLIADSMDRTAGLVNAGTGTVSLSAFSPNQPIIIGGTSATYADAIINNISTSGGLTIGSASHLAEVTIDGIVNTSSTVTGGTITLLSDANIAIAGSLTNTVETSLITTNGNILISGDLISDGDVSLQTTLGNIFFRDGFKLTSTAESITLTSPGAIAGTGSGTFTAKNGLLTNSEIIMGGETTFNIETFNIGQNITTTAGNLTFMSTTLSTSSGVVLSAGNEVNMPEFTANGDLTINGGNGVILNGASTVATAGTLRIDSGLGDLDINADLTASGDVDLITSDLVIDFANAALTITGNLSISDQAAGNGIGLVGFQQDKLNFDINEYNVITAAGILLQSSNGIVLDGDLSSTVSLAPLTINTNLLSMDGSTRISLASDLDFSSSTVEVINGGGLDIDVAGSFAMAGAMTSNAVTINAITGIDMGPASSIQTTNDPITLVTDTNDIRLGFLIAGNTSVSLTATAGDILNGQGAVLDVTQSGINIQAANANLSALDRIGVSSTDAITLDVDANGIITLGFGADTAFINNLQNTTIINNGAGTVAVGLIFSDQILGIGHNLGLSATEETSQDIDTASADAQQSSDISILGMDFLALMANDDEEDFISSILPSVPVLIRTLEGWRFEAPTRQQILDQSKQKRKDGYKYIDWF